ncbi:fluoride efflux transporter CrcB [Pantanalinema sp. GBBB05]|uniref:fluoride efflux transporter CrcB n=1 Tax=Pantanalinema sp. GBBB05 TaxID=2604139 RepID=UPI001E0BA113|nr:fluoride efflux transporter CrcB [Pantanalinema sp. GBBB05]
MQFLVGRPVLAIAIGATFGALSRFYITEFAKLIVGENFGYYGTFFINISGCFLIAYILTLAIENIRHISPELRLMTTTGFCGAYTTFSTYGLESKEFSDQGDITTFLIYWLGSAVIGMIGVQLGVFLARTK